jgi:hypothetical protein
MANKVFEDRLGVYVINPANLHARLPGIRAFGIRDVFLPRTALGEAFGWVRAAGLYAHLWTPTDDLSARDYANRTLLDVQRLGPGAVELNIELPSDPPLAAYVAETYRLIRSKRKALRLRVNLAPWKGFALAELQTAWGKDGNLYAAEQNYEGNMANLLSPADVLSNLLDWAVPRERATVCYGAHCRVLGSPERLRTLPDLARTKRGVIFSDDLMADAGLLP